MDAVMGANEAPRPRGQLPIDSARWPAAWREALAERAAIMEFDGGMGRRDAERMAMECVRREAADSGDG